MASKPEDASSAHRPDGDEPPAKERAELESLMETMRQAGPPPRVRGSDLGRSTLPVDLVDGFTLIKELGNGGQGVVFLAQQESTGRQVALKLLREGPLADGGSRHRFEREIEIVASLNHPNIVTLFGAGQIQGGHGWVAMEAVDGCSLREYIETSQLDLTARIGLLEQVSIALIEAHRHGVIHLDLKPANILINQEGQVKVVDFGLARSVLQQSGSLTMEALGGTPGFMAPEQVRGGLSACDTRTDVHALGALLFFLITGLAPYPEKESVFSSLEAIAAGELRDLKDEIARAGALVKSARLRQDLIAICGKAMAFHPDHRYSSVADFAQDLRALNSGGPVAARQGERRYRLAMAARRMRPVILVLALAAGVTWVSVNVALRQRRLTALAEDNFAHAQEIAEAFLLEIDPLLRDLPGSGPAREQIILRGTTYLTKLLQSAPDDAQLRLKAARGFHAIARVQADVYTMSSGKLEEAFHSLDLFHQALPDADQLAALSFAEREHAFVLKVQARLLAARVARDLGQTQRQKSELQLGLELFREGSPFDSFDALRAHSTVLEEWSRYQVSSGDTPSGRANLQRSRLMLEEMVERFSNQKEGLALLQRDLAVLTFHEASLAKVSGELDVAEGLLSKFHADALARFQRTDGLTAMLDTATAKERLAGIAAERKDYEAGLEWLRQARELRIQIVARQPHLPSALASQASLTNRMGELSLASGNLTAAESWFDLFQDECLAFVDRFPDFSRASRMLGVSYYKKYELAQAKDDPATALKELSSSLSVFQEMEEAGALSESDAQVPAQLLEEKLALEQQLKGS